MQNASPTTRSALLAFILAPLVGTYVLACMILVGVWANDDSASVISLIVVPIAAVIGTVVTCVIAYAVTAVVGVPIWLFLRWRRIETCRNYCLAGGLSGALILTPTALNTGELLFPITFAVPGVLVAYIFWRIAIWEPGNDGAAN